MSKLRLHIPKRIKNQGFIEDAVPTAMKEVIQDADIILNHALLLADIFGLKYEDAQESINQVYRAATYKSGLFVKEDFEDLLHVFGEIKSNMMGRLDEEGRSTRSDNIFSDQYFETDGNGRLHFKSHNVPVKYFMEDLDRIYEIFSYALANNLFVEYSI